MFFPFFFVHCFIFYQRQSGLCNVRYREWVLQVYLLRARKFSGCGFQRVIYVESLASILINWLRVVDLIHASFETACTPQNGALNELPRGYSGLRNLQLIALHSWESEKGASSGTDAAEKFTYTAGTSRLRIGWIWWISNGFDLDYMLVFCIYLFKFMRNMFFIRTNTYREGLFAGFCNERGPY